MELTPCMGSPPHMRGKGADVVPPELGPGITPAHAGKSRQYGCQVPGGWDHPRTCGEKFLRHFLLKTCWGSPPHMRGKAMYWRVSEVRRRITPACAGKSLTVSCGNTGKKDHPRVCGEKSELSSDCLSYQGSPPRMRGKVPANKVV